MIDAVCGGVLALGRERVRLLERVPVTACRS